MGLIFFRTEQAVAHVLGDVKKLRYVGFSRVESDESSVLPCEVEP